MSPTTAADLRERVSRLGDDALVDLSEVAAVCAVSGRTVERLVAAGGFVPPVRLGSARRWRLGSVRDFIREAARCEKGGADAAKRQPREPIAPVE